MTAWEYKVITRKEDSLLTEEALNALGEHGFELVSVVATQEERTVVGRHETYNVVRYFFKRPRAAK